MSQMRQMNQAIRGAAVAKPMQAVLALVLVMFASAVYAQAAGTVVQVTGTLSAQRGGGTRFLAINSAVQKGDVISTQANSYGQIRFTDGSVSTVRPNSTIRIDDYSFNQAAPQSDNAIIALLKGGLRTATGLIGKRGNQDAYAIKTSTATIGIRGSVGDTMDCSSGCDGVTGRSGGLAPGVYHVTHTDLFVMITNQGQILIAQGQFGFAGDINKPPVLLGGDPGMGIGPLPFALGSTNPVQECQVR